MKKIIVLLFTAVLCTVLLCGCRMSVWPASGLSSFCYDQAEQYTAGGAILSDAVEQVEIHWLIGRVSVEACGKNTISFSEEANRKLTEDNCLYYRLDGTTLVIQFCRSGKWDMNDLQKDLTVLLPEELLLKELSVNSVSAELCADGISAEELELDTVSGNICLKNCGVTNRAKLDTVSGSVEAELVQPLENLYAGTVSGNVEITAPGLAAFHADTTSGSVFLAVDTAPKELDVDTVSGAVTLRLPENAGFTLDFETVSGEYTSELPCAVKDGRCVCGDGSGDYEIDTTSGDVRIEGKRGEAGVKSGSHKT